MIKKILIFFVDGRAVSLAGYATKKSLIEPANSESQAKTNEGSC